MIELNHSRTGEEGGGEGRKESEDRREGRVKMGEKKGRLSFSLFVFRRKANLFLGVDSSDTVGAYFAGA